MVITLAKVGGPTLYMGNYLTETCPKCLCFYDHYNSFWLPGHEPKAVIRCISLYIVQNDSLRLSSHWQRHWPD